MLHDRPRHRGTALLIINIPGINGSAIVGHLQTLNASHKNQTIGINSRPKVAQTLSKVIGVLRRPGTCLMSAPKILVPGVRSDQRNVGLTIAKTLVSRMIKSFLLISCLFTCLHARSRNGQTERFLGMASVPASALLFVRTITGTGNVFGSGNTFGARGTVELVLGSFHRNSLNLCALSRVPSA